MIDRGRECPQTEVCGTEDVGVQANWAVLDSYATRSADFRLRAFVVLGASWLEGIRGRQGFSRGLRRSRIEGRDVLGSEG